MSDRPERLIFTGEQVTLGEFHCPPGSSRWSEENWSGDGHLLAFPGTTVVIERGRDAVVATPNHVIFYDPRQTYRRRLVDPHGDHCAFVVVDPTLLVDIARARADEPDRFRFPVGHGPVD